MPSGLCNGLWRKGGGPISAAFDRLDAAKKKRILDAAMAEFARYGYEGASTNRIVKAAGIGKGMLFHYFNSKRELFQYLTDYAIERVEREYLPKIDLDETDYLEKYRQAAAVKMEAFLRDPHLFHFLGEAYLNAAEQLTKEQQERLDRMQRDLLGRFTEKVDTGLFRDDIDAAQVQRIIRWTLDGYSQDLIVRLEGKNLSELDMTAYWDEFYRLLADLRKMLYKDGKESKYGDRDHS